MTKTELQRVEDFADMVDEFVNVIFEGAIVGGDQGQFGVEIKKRIGQNGAVASLSKATRIGFWSGGNP
jgi:hypothetical protein